MATKAGKSSATMVRATCADCGDIAVTADEVTIRKCKTPQQAGNLAATFVLRCPACRMVEARPVTWFLWPHLVRLEQAGARVEWWDLPDELADPARHLPAPVVSHDDVLDFHFDLQQPGWLASVVGKGAA